MLITTTAYLSDSETGGGLPPAHPAQPGLVLHDAVGHPHLTAQGWQEHHQLGTTKMIKKNQKKKRKVKVELVENIYNQDVNIHL